MIVTKRKLGNLEKCYSIAQYTLGNEQGFLVASEKQFPCFLFNDSGEYVETVWEYPGGTMSMVQVPGRDEFLAVHRFYSPNDSKEASIVLCRRFDSGWEYKTLVKLPHVHRFDILSRNGINYLIMCTLFSKREYKDDWTYPGQVYAAVLTDECLDYCSHKELDIKLIKDGLFKNHGYYRGEDQNGMFGVVTCESGAYVFTPPESEEGEWNIQKILDDPISDLVFVDLDSDGNEEIAAIKSFHGDELIIYKKIGDQYLKVYTYPEKLEFIHAIWGGTIKSEPYVFIGHRKGDQAVLALKRSNKKDFSIEAKIIDNGVGSANFYHYRKDRQDIIISANRETDEIAMYVIE